MDNKIFEGDEGEEEDEGRRRRKTKEANDERDAGPTS